MISFIYFILPPLILRDHINWSISTLLCGFKRGVQDKIKSKQNKSATKEVILLLQINNTVLADLPELKKTGH